MKMLDYQLSKDCDCLSKTKKGQNKMTIYKIDDEVVSIETFNDRLYEELENQCDEDWYDDMLDNCYDTIKFGNLSYTPSQVLKCVDPIAYRCGLTDTLDSELGDANYELLQKGEVSVNGVNFTTSESDDE